MSQASSSSSSNSAATYYSGAATSGNSTSPWLLAGIVALAIAAWLLFRKKK